MKKNKILSELIEPFAALFKTSSAHKIINFTYLLEGVVYFGMLTLMAMFFNRYAGLNDIQAGQTVSVLTGGITLSMIFFGAAVDIAGIRKALLWSFLFLAVGRISMVLAPSVFHNTGMWSDIYLMAMAGMVGIIAGYGIYQPACYAAVKQFTDKNTSAPAYAMLYALMNLGGFIPGLISAPLRRWGDVHFNGGGILTVYWFYFILTLIAGLFVFFFLTPKRIKAAQTEENSRETDEDPSSSMTVKEKFKYYIKNFPFKDLRFMYFIFILIPVQTLFAHNWLTIPQYCERAFQGGIVSANFEFFSNINPILIFILTPIIASFTAKAEVYRMMILGTFVMGLPAFFLSAGPNIWLLMAYLLFMTVGEAIWQPRFLQLIADIAPPGMCGIYMGIGQFPWFLTKVITGLYSGWFLMKYCPQGALPSQMNTGFMWFIYGLIAIISPVGLVLASKWIRSGLFAKQECK